MSQLVSAFNRWESQGSGNLPSQTIINPKQNASAITLRNGKELLEPSKRISEQAIEEAIEKEEVEPNPKDRPQQKSRDELPVSSRFAKSKKEEKK